MKTEYCDCPHPMPSRPDPMKPAQCNMCGLTIKERRHPLAPAIRGYLLGTLGMDAARMFEEKYFTDPEFFDEVRAIEIKLIVEFLDGKLGLNEEARFTSRYLEIPILKRLVNEVRIARAEKKAKERS